MTRPESLEIKRNTPFESSPRLIRGLRIRPHGAHQNEREARPRARSLACASADCLAECASLAVVLAHVTRGVPGLQRALVPGVGGSRATPLPHQPAAHPPATVRVSLAGASPRSPRTR